MFNKLQRVDMVNIENVVKERREYSHQSKYNYRE